MTAFNPLGEIQYTDGVLAGGNTIQRRDDCYGTLALNVLVLTLGRRWARGWLPAESLHQYTRYWHHWPVYKLYTIRYVALMAAKY